MKLYRRHKLPAAVRYAVWLVLATQVLVGCLWMAKNLGHVPVYGDTPEYIRLSQTLAIDQFRTILYPLVVRFANSIAGVIDAPYQVVIYLLQVTVSFFSILYLTTRLTRQTGRVNGRLAIRDYWLPTVFLTLIIVTTPMVAHYNFSVLSDSLALSFTLIFVAGTVGLFARSRVSWGEMTVVTVSYILMAITRPERLVVGALFIGVLAAGVLIRELPRPSRLKLDVRVVALLVAMVIGFAGAKAVNTMTQMETRARLQPSLSNTVYARVTWMRLAKAYRYLPADIQAVIDYEDAAAVDKNPLTTGTTIEKILRHDNGSSRNINRITKITFQRFWPEIIRDFVSDFLQNLVAPVTVAVDWLIHNADTRWNVSRMSAAHPNLTNIYLNYSAIVLALLVLYGAYRSTGQRVETGLDVNTAIIVFVFIFVVSLFFAFTANPTTNIRYLMPVYALEYAAVLTILRPALFPI